MSRFKRWSTRLLPIFVAAILFIGSASAQAPSVVDQKLAVRTVMSGLVTPISMAFLGPNEFLLLHKNSGQVTRVSFGTSGSTASTVLDLAVNNASERGLLGV